MTPLANTWTFLPWRGWRLAAAGAVALSCALAAAGRRVDAGERELLDLTLRSPLEERGDYDALARAWLEALPDHAPDVRSELLVRRLVSILPFAGDRAGLVPLVEKALEARYTNGTTTQALLEVLGGLYLAAGRVQDHARINGNRGYLVQWLVAGPFGKDKLAPYFEAFPPEREIKLDAAYVDDWQEIRWRKVIRSRPEPQIQPAEHVFPGGGVNYFLTHVEAVRPLDAALLRGAQDRLRVWLNGELVVDDDPSALRLESRRASPVRILQGWNRVLVKAQGPFWLRLAQPDATSFAAGDWREEQELAAHTPAGAGVAATHPVLAFAFAPWRQWAAKLLQDVSGAGAASDADKRLAADAQIGLALLGQYYGRDDLAVEAAQKAIDLVPGDAWAHFHAGDVFESAAYLPRTIAKDRALKAFQTANELSADLLPAYERLAKFLEDDNKPALAARKVLDALERRPELARGLLRLSSIYARRGWDAEHIDVMRRLEALGPGWTAPAELWANRHVELHAPRQALEYQKRVTELKQDDIPAWMLRADLHVQVGELAEAEAALRRGLAVNPDSDRLARMLADLKADQGQIDEALALVRAAAGRNPQSPAGEIAAAGILLHAGRDEDAAGSLRRALELDPGNVTARRSLARLSPPGAPAATAPGGESFWTQYDEKLEDWVLQVPETGPLVDKAASIIVLDISVVRVHPDGSTTEYVHQVSKLLSEESKDDLARVQTPGEILLLRTVTPDGESLEPVPGQGGRSWVMPGMTRGALVEHAYRSDGEQRRAARRLDTFYFQDTRMRQSFLLSRYVLLLPEGFDDVIVENNISSEAPAENGGPALARVKKSVQDLPGGGKVVIYEARNVPRLEEERFMPEPEEYIPNVALRGAHTWEDIANSRREADRGASLPTPELERAAREAVKDAGEPLERARAIYRWVQTNIPTAGSNNRAAAVLLEKSGDRTVLLKSLLELAGVPVTWAYLRPREEMLPKTDWNHPQPAFFRYPYLALHVGGGAPVYASLQDRQAPMGRLPQYFEGGKALLLTPGGGYKIEGIARLRPEENAVKITAQMALGDSADVTCEIDTTTWSVAGFSQKEQLRSMPSTLKDQAVNVLIGRLFRGAKVENGEIKHLDDWEHPLSVTAKLIAPKLLRPSGDELLLRPVVQPAQLVNSFAGRSSREHPFHFRSELVLRDTLRVDSGDKMKLARTPKDVTLTSALGTYSLTYKPEGNILVVTRELTLSPGRLAAADHAAFVAMCQKIDAAERESIAYRKI